jgi:UDP-2,3-diacylglucosamine hydrolase
LLALIRVTSAPSASGFGFRFQPHDLMALMPDTLGLIAGNGRFPFLVLDAARAKGERVIVAAIKEETDPEITARAARDADVRVHWLSLGELSKLIEAFQREGVSRAIMAGQVKHKQIFSSIRPDWRLAKLLLSLGTRNTDSLLAAIGKVLADEGITLLSSTSYLEPLLARAGILTKRPPSDQEQKNIAYGRGVARQLGEYDIGQTVVIAESACVAVEAMEGTDAAIARAGDLMRTLHQGEMPESFLSRALTVVKVAKPKQDLRFDVPVVGVKTIEIMRQAGATCLAVDAERCLFLDGERIIDAANEAGIAIVSSA